jgi:hypothetical protein
VLTKWNGKRATGRFIQTALKVPEDKVGSWMEKNFKDAWAKYDVLCQDKIDENMIATYFRSPCIFEVLFHPTVHFILGNF